MERKHKYSRKREAILSKIRSTTSHPSAEWVYGQLKHELSDLSLGTVYRNIAMFKSEGIIASVGVVGGEERFDGNTDEHVHFVCECCGVIIDVESDCDNSMADAANGLCEKYGFEIFRRNITYFGKCAECKQLSDVH